MGSLTFGAVPSDSQSLDDPAVLSGVVTDPSGARIARASIHIHSQSLDRDVVTNATGSFAVDVPGDAYTLTAEAPGFRRLTRETRVEPGDHRNLELRLSIDVAAEEISVGPFVGSSDQTGALSFSGSELQMLSDDPAMLRQQLIAMAGGGTGIAAPQFYVDGFSNGQVPPKSAIRAVHLNSNPYSAAYDTPGFGRVEIETQAGGNQLHGMLDVGGTQDAMNSGNPFAEVQPPYYQLLYRGNVSGPMGKTSSYFLAGNSSDLQNNAVVNAVDPAAPDATLSEGVPNPQWDNDYSLRVDHRFSAANQIYGRYEIHHVQQTNAGVGLLVLESAGYTNHSTAQTLQLDDNEIFNSKVVNDTRFQYIRSRLSQNPNSTQAAIIVQGAFSGGGSPTQKLDDNLDQYELQDNLSIEHGQHFIRAGMRYRFNRDSNDSRAGYNGQYIFPDVTSYQAGTPTQFSLTAGQSSAVVSTGDLAVYGDDEWKLAQHFTLKYGLRYETQSATPDHNDPAPRVGFTWAITRKASKMPVMMLRGGSGVFYQRLSAADLLPSVRQNGVNQLAYLVQNPTFYPVVPPPSSLSETEPTIYRVDPRLRTSRTVVSGIVAERMIGRIAKVTANFTDAEGRHQYLMLNANAPLPRTYDPANPASGMRPFGGIGNIYQETAEGTGHAQMFTSNVTLMPKRGVMVYAFYIAQRNHSDANGTSWFTSNSYNIRQDYGRDDSNIAQEGFFGGAFNLPYGVAVQPFIALRSGRPFNITTGSDLNGDTIYNDRPAFATDLSRPSVVRTAYGNFDANPLPSQQIIPYNYGNGPGLFWVDLQTSRDFRVGPRAAMSAASQPGAGPPAKPERPWTLSFSVEAQNLFNHVNPANPVGVLSSPLFGHSLSVATDYSALTAANRTILLHSTFNF
ncbi:MAG TPA: TonB-dependent receptor [Acidobacteriaceae bacterium]